MGMSQMIGVQTASLATIVPSSKDSFMFHFCVTLKDARSAMNKRFAVIVSIKGTRKMMSDLSALSC